MIDFYKKPAVIELYEKYNGNITHITVNGDYIDGDKNKAIKLYEWLESSKKEFEDIIWEWEKAEFTKVPIQKQMNGKK